MKRILSILFVFFLTPVFAENTLGKAEQIYEAARITCSGISDEIAKVANISKANTAVTAVGTVAAGGALVAGIKKNQHEEEIDRLIKKICDAGGCDSGSVEAMDLNTFFNEVVVPFGQIAELMQLQEEVDKAKTAGNWRTGLMAGTIGTNLASAIMSGINVNQSDLVQHITACNEMVNAVKDVSMELQRSGINPNDALVVKKLNGIKTWCNQIDVKDIEKIEKRMKGVMGTSIAGTAIGIVGTGTSAAANSDNYMSLESKISMSEEDKKKERALNVASNVMAGANIATGAVETGLNISLITLTKKLMEAAQRCEDVL